MLIFSLTVFTVTVLLILINFHEQTAVLIVIGINRKGEEEFLTMDKGYRDSANSWREVFRDLKRQGLQKILSSESLLNVYTIIDYDSNKQSTIG
jgi:hypothetical protein